MQQSEPRILKFVGGEGRVVQIDESVITKRKYNRGRVVPERWIIGIYDVSMKTGYIQYIARRTADTLETVIQAHVRQGSEIWTDKWRGYNNLKNLGYTHKTVNHSKYFKDPDTGVCTNQVEGYWSKLKQYLRRLGVMSSPFLPEYIDVFLWEQQYGQTAQNRMSNLISHIAERYGN